jgi:hypothetical protein
MKSIPCRLEHHFVSGTKPDEDGRDWQPWLEFLFIHRSGWIRFPFFFSLSHPTLVLFHPSSTLSAIRSQIASFSHGVAVYHSPILGLFFFGFSSAAFHFFLSLSIVSQRWALVPRNPLLVLSFVLFSTIRSRFSPWNLLHKHLLFRLLRRRLSLLQQQQQPPPQHQPQSRCLSLSNRVVAESATLWKAPLAVSSITSFQEPNQMKMEETGKLGWNSRTSTATVKLSPMLYYSLILVLFLFGLYFSLSPCIPWFSLKNKPPMLTFSALK